MTATLLVIGSVFFQLLALGYAIWFGIRDDDLCDGASWSIYKAMLFSGLALTLAAKSGGMGQ